MRAIEGLVVVATVLANRPAWASDRPRFAEQGSVFLGGDVAFGYSSESVGAGSETAETESVELDVGPVAGYFVIDGLALQLTFRFAVTDSESEDAKTNTDAMLLGGALSYYLPVDADRDTFLYATAAVAGIVNGSIEVVAEKAADSGRADFGGMVVGGSLGVAGAFGRAPGAVLRAYVGIDRSDTDIEPEGTTRKINHVSVDVKIGTAMAIFF